LNLNFIFKESFLNSDFTEIELKRCCKKASKLIASDNKIIFGTINFLFCNSKTIKDYNKKYLSRNYETDIITFEYKEIKENFVDSDIIISVNTVAKNAGFFKTNFKEELLRVIIHGILHLCGFKDKLVREKRTMRETENYYLNKLKLNAG
jgi:rRNA maturation RNase YbeY